MRRCRSSHGLQRRSAETFSTRSVEWSNMTSPVIDALFRTLGRVCAITNQPFPLCRVGGDYGTVSSSLVAVKADGTIAAYWHAPGPPSEVAFAPSRFRQKSVNLGLALTRTPRSTAFSAQRRLVVQPALKMADFHVAVVPYLGMEHWSENSPWLWVGQCQHDTGATIFMPRSWSAGP